MIFLALTSQTVFEIFLCRIKIQLLLFSHFSILLLFGNVQTKTQKYIFIIIESFLCFLACDISSILIQSWGKFKNIFLFWSLIIFFLMSKYSSKMNKVFEIYLNYLPIQSFIKSTVCKFSDLFNFVVYYIDF